MLGKLSCSLPSADFFQNKLFDWITIRVSKGLDPDQGLDNGPNCLQRLLAAYKSRHLARNKLNNICFVYVAGHNQY